MIEILAILYTCNSDPYILGIKEDKYFMTGPPPTREMILLNHYKPNMHACTFAC